MAIRLPSESRLDLGYVPLRPEVMSTGDPAKEGTLCDCSVLAKMSVCAPVDNHQSPSSATRSTLVIHIIAISLESGDHLFRTFDARAWHFRWGWRSFATVGVDHLALVWRHVHILLAVASGNPTEHVCQSLRLS